MTEPASFSCPRCGAVSYNLNDVEHGYCGRCHDFTGDPHRQALTLEERVAATACPGCEQKALRVELRPELQARPIGSFSLAGQQMKFSAVKAQVPWLVCGNCGAEARGKR